MKDELFEELAKKYPDLFEKAKVEYFEIREGWFTLIDILCGCICTEVTNIKNQISYKSQIRETDPEVLERLEQKLKQAIDALPTIVQVKEKFGGLRFYVDGGNDEMHHYIKFAENASYHFCEVCGSPGTSRKGNWIKVLCDQHDRKEKQFQENFFKLPKLTEGK